jgi:ribosomal protein S18 acetylase RimI-like enzyme
MADTNIEYANLTMADYPEVYALWSGMPGIGLSSADSPESIFAYLERNPGMSFVARQEGKVVGAVLCGHDGRRGYLQHLAVSPEIRTRRIGTTLVEKCLETLGDLGIRRCHIFVYQDNETGLGFWESAGWFRRDDLLIMSHDLETIFKNPAET